MEEAGRALSDAIRRPQDRQAGEGGIGRVALMSNPDEQWWSWKRSRDAITDRPWLILLFALDLLLVGAILGGAGREHIIPVGTLFAGTVAAFVTLGQLGVARRQAAIAQERHQRQTEADHQRRITESFIKAVEQLGSEKQQVRVGGIYTMEHISRESEVDYWPVMETLTAFVRESACWNGNREASSTPPDTASEAVARKPKPAADIAAVLDVLYRRRRMKLEREKGLWLDLSSADLRGANIRDTHLKGADLRDAHLERASLMNAHLEDANIRGAHLEGADLRGAHLEGANIRDAHLEGADLRGAHLEGAKGLKQAQLDAAFGNEWTTVPNGMTRPPTKKKTE
jgi:hypothetical protein